MSERLPSGTVTLLFTDIEGSTSLLQRVGPDYAGLLQTHRQLVRDAIAENEGVEVGTEGDSFFVAFSDPVKAVRAAFDAQRALCTHIWPEGREVRVRMGLHTGAVVVVANDYVGLAVHHAARVSSAAHGGQILLSSDTAQAAAHDLPWDGTLRDLGRFVLKGIEGEQHLIQLVHPDLPDDFPEPSTRRALRSNLPTFLTSFVGREPNLTDVLRLLDEARIVTLIGPGGIGKTRLAIEAATRAMDGYVDGVWFVDLAAVAAEAVVPQTVGSVLGLRESKDDVRAWPERLSAYLSDKSALIVLDNCEHLLRACGDLVVRLLQSCPTLRFLATSREALGVQGERRYGVRPLDLPQDESEDLASSTAVRLFVDRARERDLDFALDDQGTRTVAGICRRLDSLPLAIELAAASTDVLPLSQIAAQLDDRFRMLRADDVRAERHSTMETAIDWSYELLDERDRTLFRRLAVFAGFGSSDAEAVCTGAPIVGTDVLDALARLTRKSLVDRDSSTGRFRMLETIRHYALGRLADAGEEVETRSRHRDHFVARVEALEREAFEGAFDGAVDRFGADVDNVWLALAWTTPEDDGQAALRICGAALLFWDPQEGLSQARRALDADRGPGSPARLKALATAMTCALGLEPISEVARLTEEAAALAVSPPERADECWARTNVAISSAWVTAYRDGDLARARTICQEAIDSARRIGHRWATGTALSAAANMARLQEDYAGARPYLEEALRLLESPMWKPSLLGSLAEVVLELGDNDGARALAEEALRIGRESRNPMNEAWGLYALSLVALRQGDVAMARASGEEWLALGRTIGDRISGESIPLAHLALAHALAQDWRKADERFAESLAVVEEFDLRPIVAFNLYALGEVGEQLGEFAQARDRYERALSLYRELNDKAYAFRCLERLGAVAASEGRHEDAARLREQAGAERGDLEVPTWTWRELFPLNTGHPAVHEPKG